LLNTLRDAWRRGRSLFPIEGYTFDRPLVILQSDDWGRTGVRDKEGWEELRDLGLNLGECGYDFYSLETADDVAALVSLLERHPDWTGRPACFGMNFILANVDFARVKANDFREIYLRALTGGLPDGWNRPGLFEAYRQGVSAGAISPALHGLTHFCRPAAEKRLADPGEQGILLRTLWSAGVPYIHWRMPWVGFEYWDSEREGDESFLPSGSQEDLVRSATKCFTDFFSQPPRSACAPGYRANLATHESWAANGIRVAQNGPGKAIPPHFDSNDILHLYRSIDFEPAVDAEFSLSKCAQTAQAVLARGLPLVVSMHSINFHSSIKDFRSRTLTVLDEFLTTLEAKYPDLLYVSDEDLYNVIETGTLRSLRGTIRIRATKRKFVRSVVAPGWTA
jgi:hypothetical protein